MEQTCFELHVQNEWEWHVAVPGPPRAFCYIPIAIENVNRRLTEGIHGFAVQLVTSYMTAWSEHDQHRVQPCSPACLVEAIAAIR